MFKYADTIGSIGKKSSEEKGNLGSWAASNLSEKKKELKILLVDDDPTFGKIMKKVADQYHIALTFCKTIEEFSAEATKAYDIAIIDYDLGAVTGSELTAYIEDVSQKSVPVILVSQTHRDTSHGFPETIKEFVHKTRGPHAIFKAAQVAYEVHQATEKNKKQF